MTLTEKSGHLAWCALVGVSLDIENYCTLRCFYVHLSCDEGPTHVDGVF